VEKHITDQFSDPGFKILSQQIQRFPEVDTFIKSAELNDEENEKRASSAFAWEERRLFPVDDAGQAALSRLYMEKQAGVPQRVIEKCDKALELYGINMPFQEKTASAAADFSDYLLPDMQRFYVKTAEDVRLASEAILRNTRRMDTDTKALASVRLAKKAAALNENIPIDILKFAGATMCNTRVLRDWLEARSVATSDPQIMCGYQKLAEEVYQLPELCSDREELVKVACVVQELDQAAGLEERYGRTLLDPLLTVFNTEKISDELMTLAGRQVSLDQLLSIDPEIYKDVFGDDLAAEFVNEATGDIDAEQLKIILPTVPLDLQKTLVVQMGV